MIAVVSKSANLILWLFFFMLIKVLIISLTLFFEISMDFTRLADQNSKPVIIKPVIIAIKINSNDIWNLYCTIQKLIIAIGIAVNEKYPYLFMLFIFLFIVFFLSNSSSSFSRSSSCFWRVAIWRRISSSSKLMPLFSIVHLFKLFFNSD